MTEPGRSLPPTYFDRIYAENDDPWGFETRPYEAEKYCATLAALLRGTYRSAFEIGCSIGVLTEGLAGRCGELLSVDVSERALKRARERCSDLTHVHFEVMRVPGEFPQQSFDLILVSEVGYYWSRENLLKARRRIVEHLDPGGQVLLVHWTPFVDDYPLTGDEVHDTFHEPAVTGIAATDGDEAQLLALAAAVESDSEHPLARAIVSAAQDRSVSIPSASDFQVIAGRGVEALVGEVQRLRLAVRPCSASAAWISQTRSPRARSPG